MVATRHVEFGTVKPVRVDAVITHGSYVGVVCIAADEPKSPYILLHRKDGISAAEGDRGVITFTRGGPLGGYWKFERQRQQD